MTNLTSLIRDSFDGAWNANDVEGVLRHFADDAVVQTVPPMPGAPEVFRGKGEIRGFVQMLIPNFHVDSKDFAESADRVTWYATVTSDTIRGQFGVDSLSADCEAIIQNGQVKSFKPVFTQETLAKLQAAAVAR
jgi:hypothetical protein